MYQIVDFRWFMYRGRLPNFFLLFSSRPFSLNAIQSREGTRTAGSKGSREILRRKRSNHWVRLVSGLDPRKDHRRTLRPNKLVLHGTKLSRIGWIRKTRAARNPPSRHRPNGSPLYLTFQEPAVSLHQGPGRPWGCLGPGWWPPCPLSAISEVSRRDFGCPAHLGFPHQVYCRQGDACHEYYTFVISQFAFLRIVCLNKFWNWQICIYFKKDASER